MLNHARQAVLIVSVSLASAAPNAPAETIILSDHFDDGALDPAWQITFENASDWTYGEIGTNLVANDIEHVEDDVWARVYLTRPLPTQLDNFHVRAEVAWTSGTQEEVMHYVRIQLLDGEGESIANAYYWDAWVMHRGGLGGGISDGSSWFSGLNTQPHNGASVLELERCGDDVSVWIGGDLRVTGISSQPAAMVQIDFGFFSAHGQWKRGLLVWVADRGPRRSDDADCSRLPGRCRLQLRAGPG